MAHILISQANADALLALRKTYGSKGNRTAAGREKSRAIFRKIKEEAGLNQSKKIVVFIENPLNPLYRVIRDANTKMPLDDGHGVIPEIAAVELPAKPVAKPKKTSPAKKASTKPAAKKATAKPAAKPAKAPAKKAAPTTPAKPKKAPAPSKDLYDAPKDVRITVDGVRIRIGKATSDAHKARIIAKYKKENGIQ